MVDHAKFIMNAMNASDLMQGYIDIVINELENLTVRDRILVLDQLESFDPSSAEEAAAKAAIIFIIKKWE